MSATVGQNGGVSTTFPRVSTRELGYDIDQVEGFLDDARVAYTTEPGTPTGLSSRDIRRAAFALRKGGYSPQHVDAALERLEDAFALRERDDRVRLVGEQAWHAELRTLAEEIIARLERKDGQRFQRVSVLSDGYDRKQVDEFAVRLLGYFRSGTPVSVHEVRTIAFRPRRGGYREAQVDLFLDAVVELMLAVRQ